MTEEKTNSKEKMTIIDLIKLQLIWYLTNFLIIFCQNYIQFELPYFNDLYQIIFKVIGRSFFISFLLYWTTIYNLSFEELGIKFKNFLEDFEIGLEFSLFLLLGIIIINLSISEKIIHPLVKISNLTELTLSLFYFGIVVISYLIPAFSKELLYRGLLFYYFKDKLGAKLGFIVSNLYYVVSYLDLRPGSIIIHLLVGIITTYLYYKTESLIASTIFQTIYQASLIVYLFSFSNWPF
ncbi:CAAX amino terminal protease family [Halobacteroides halobius DSM 5150]|uniref:CAAX amino terminal protease family n=1 Tax=Halobacteroides halobius (strain ATCC 35273 / DSM 5150 / MD-1) TaxID=748449 RepID=L0K797_HALHC|nr:CPBP family intramembrane glutamic endopeptidase [Halobacteroides halobius]AGB40239.1 CAAX amino terminal protease family [Halobacteroides halobius DSM 5150]